MTRSRRPERAEAAANADGDSNPDSDQDSQSTADKLLTRATQINNSLLLSLNFVLDAKNAIDADLQACKVLSCELANWERALAELEIAVVASQADNDVAEDNTVPADTHGNDSNQLLRTIELQKSQINSLEKKLHSFIEESTDFPQAEDNQIAVETNASVQSVATSNRLIIAMDRDGNLKFPLEQNIVTIGRQPGSDIYIRSRYLSRYHARILSDAKGAIIEDLDSANGVLVNSRRVRRCLLRSGDRITLGKTQLQYIDISEDTEDAGQA